MKQSIKFQLIIIGFVAFFLFSSLPLQSQRTIADLERMFGTYEKNLKDCEIEAEEFEEELDYIDITKLKAPDTYVIETEGRLTPVAYSMCNFNDEFGELFKDLNNLANPGDNVIIPEEERKKIEKLKVKLDELIERNDNLQKKRAELEARAEKLKKDYEKAKIGMLNDPQAAKELVEALMEALGVDVDRVTEGDREHFYNVFIKGVNSDNAAEKYQGSYRVDPKNINSMNGECILVSLVVIEGILHILLNKPDIFRIGIVPIDGGYRLLRGMLEFLIK